MKRGNKMELLQTILFSIGMFVIIAVIFAVIIIISRYLRKLINISFHWIKSKINK